MTADFNIASAVPFKMCLFGTGWLLIISQEPHIYVSTDKHINENDKDVIN